MKHVEKSFSLVIFLCISVQMAFGQEKVFFGNLHSHTSYSDGSGMPMEAYTFARDVAKLDFLALTEHNHAEALGSDGIGIATNNALYKGVDPNSLISTAGRFTIDDRFVALYGQEFSTISSGNHANVFDIGEVIDVPKGQFDKLDRFLQEHKDSSGQDAIVMFNHPKNTSEIVLNEYGFDDFSDVTQWLAKMGVYAHLIQMINGPGQNPGTNLPSASPDEAAFKKFLNLGFKLAPTADQDNHEKNWGAATNARTAVVTTRLTKENVLGAMRARHVYATEDKNLKVIIKVNDHLCGDVIAPLPAPGELLISYSIEDGDEPDSEYEIQVWRDSVGGPVANMVSAVTVNAGSGSIEDVAFSGEPQYLYFKVIQRDESGNEDRVWTAPVWFEKQGGTGTILTVVTEATDDDLRLVASKNSKVYHLSDKCLDAKRIKPSNRINGRDAKKGRQLHTGCPRRGPE